MNLTEEIKHNEIKNIPLPAQKMHRLVWILVGTFTAIAVSFPIAMLRVSQEAKFDGSHVISIEQSQQVRNNK